MIVEAGFDLAGAHRYFSAACFDQAWTLMEKPDRTEEENEEMIRLSLASLWHWTQREDCTDQNLSVGCWQTSRICAILGQSRNARRYGRISLEAARKGRVPPFYVAYAFEALARAECIAGNQQKMNEYLADAHRYAESVEDDKEKQMLRDDLTAIPEAGRRKP